jgi:shikimate dehydrogenase
MHSKKIKEEDLDCYAVFGNPITHSLSPLIHSLFAKQTQQQLTYTAVHVEQNKLAKTLDDFQTQRGKGINITSPFKRDAFLLVNASSQRAQTAQAINTILFNENGQRFGDNTDGVGLVKDLACNHALQLNGKRVLILGAGGATQGILAPLLNENPTEIIITNRTMDKAHELANQFAHFGLIQARALSELINHSFDLIINATSIGLQGKCLSLPDTLLKNTFCYDLAYGQAAMPFLQEAKKQGAYTYCDGLGMLVEQAAESFYLWRGVKPDTQSVYKALKQLLEDREDYLLAAARLEEKNPRIPYKKIRKELGLDN